MSTTVIAVLLALGGTLAVLGVAWAFYLVGRSEDRARQAEARPADPPAAAEPDEHAVARERRRPLPPRRP
jgi:flagellar basal body-associated protein FliL